MANRILVSFSVPGLHLPAAYYSRHRRGILRKGSPMVIKLQKVPVGTKGGKVVEAFCGECLECHASLMFTKQEVTCACRTIWQMDKSSPFEVVARSE
jgi:hypothetical protein